MSNKSYLDRLSKSEHDLWKTKLQRDISFADINLRISDIRLRIPVLVTDAIRNNDIRQLSHDSLGSTVHELQSPAIIRLLKRIFIGKSIQD